MNFELPPMVNCTRRERERKRERERDEEGRENKTWTLTFAQNRHLLTVAKRERSTALERHECKVFATCHRTYGAVPVDGIDLDRRAMRGAAGVDADGETGDSKRTSKADELNG